MEVAREIEPDARAIAEELLDYISQKRWLIKEIVLQKGPEEKNSREPLALATVVTVEVGSDTLDTETFRLGLDSVQRLTAALARMLPVKPVRTEDVTKAFDQGLSFSLYKSRVRVYAKPKALPLTELVKGLAGDLPFDLYFSLVKFFDPLHKSGEVEIKRFVKANDFKAKKFELSTDGKRFKALIEPYGLTMSAVGGTNVRLARRDDVEMDYKEYVLVDPALLRTPVNEESWLRTTAEEIIELGTVGRPLNATEKKLLTEKVLLGIKIIKVLGIVTYELTVPFEIKDRNYEAFRSMDVYVGIMRTYDADRRFISTQLFLINPGKYDEFEDLFYEKAKN